MPKHLVFLILNPSLIFSEFVRVYLLYLLKFLILSYVNRFPLISILFRFGVESISIIFRYHFLTKHLFIDPGIPSFWLSYLNVASTYQWHPYDFLIGF